jgi:predicted acylesterase/phospholipase RssA
MIDLAEFKPKPRRLIFSGGGIRVISFVGAVEQLHKANQLTDIQEYVGVSAGAFLAFILILGYNFDDIKNIIRKFDFGNIRSIDDPLQLLLFNQNLGIDNGDNLVKLLHSLLKHKGFPPDITLGQLGAATKKHMRCYATDLNKIKVHEFSDKATPDIKVTVALCATMSIPFYFMPVRDPITNNILTDGGCISNYPIGHLSTFEIQESIGFTFDDYKNDHQTINGAFDFLYQIMSCYWVPRNKQLYTKYRENTIIVPCSKFPSWNFEATEEDKTKLMELGGIAAKNFLKGVSRKQQRRRSVS